MKKDLQKGLDKTKVEGPDEIIIGFLGNVPKNYLLLVNIPKLIETKQNTKL